jgi:phosphate-selective porin OprO and OprP
MLRGLLAAFLALTPVPAAAQLLPTAAAGTMPVRPPVVEDTPFKALRFVWRDHPSVRAGRNFRIDFQAKSQWDGRRPGDEPADFDTYELHRARVGVDGELFRHIEFSLERELTEREADTGSSSKSAWKDAYVEANYTRVAQVRVGKFKIPFGLEQLTGISNLDFVYRSLSASYLAPARDVGVMVHGRFFDRGLNYWAGVFRQDGENARSSSIEGGDETGAVRVTTAPFRKGHALEHVEVGAAVTVSRLSDASVRPNGLRGRSVMSHYVFYEPVFVGGQRRRFETDFDGSFGPFGARAEYTHVLDTRDKQGLADQDLTDARARSWYASGSWVMTGEEKERPVKPRRKAGALEVVGRYERIRFDSAGGPEPAVRNPRAALIFPSGERVLSLGLNWHLNRWVKLQVQTMREQALDPERSAVAGGQAFWSPVFRLQAGI